MDTDIDRSELIIEDDQFCFDPVYRKRTLKLVKESPFIGLFHDLKGQTRFEASGINIANNAAYVIFDNLRTLGKISLDFKFMGTDNVLISEAGEPEAESQFEGLAYLPKTDTFLVVRETFVKKIDPADGSDDQQVNISILPSSCPVLSIILVTLHLTMVHDMTGA